MKITNKFNVVKKIGVLTKYGIAFHGLNIETFNSLGCCEVLGCVIIWGANDRDQNEVKYLIMLE